MFNIVILIVFLSGIGAVEKELTYGPWNEDDCYNRIHHYEEMYDSMPGFAVIEAACVSVKKE